MSRYTRVAAAAALLALVTACAETPHSFKSTSTDTATSAPVEDTPAEDTPTESTPVTASLGTCSVGDHVTLGDWKIAFVKFERNANKAIANANMFNERPEVQYILVTYKATYNGDARSEDVQVGLTWTLTGADKVVIDPASQVTPYDNQNKSTTARKGGTVSAQVVFDARPKGAILSVETVISGDYAECRL